MTTRELIEKFASLNNVDPELVEAANAILAKMSSDREKNAAKRAEKLEKTYAPYIQKFVNSLDENPKTATDLKNSVFANEIAPSGKNISVQFISIIAKKAIEKNLCQQIEISIPKKGKQKAYIAAK